MILLSICRYMLPFRHFYNFYKIFPRPSQVSTYFMGWEDPFREFLEHLIPQITLSKLFFSCPNSFVKDVFQQQLLLLFKSIRLDM